MKFPGKHSLSSLRSFLTQSDYRLLHKSPFFDSAYYLDQNPDVAKTGIDPILHYMSAGYLELRKPSELFDIRFYISQTPELLSRGDDPLIHFLRIGYRQGLQPHPFFDPVFYEQEYHVKNCLENPSINHYLQKGLEKQFSPHKGVHKLVGKPVISIVVPVYNPTATHLEKCIRSVYLQSYPHWQLCLADDFSTKSHVRPILEKWAAKDTRIVVTFARENAGISTASNAAAELATGDYLAFLDNDDELAIEALFILVREINKQPAQLYYSDEDLVDEEGALFSVFYKPSFNRQLLFCHNYVTHLMAMDTTLFHQVGGFDSRKDGAQDYDLFLRVSERADTVVHIPRILYHWRASQSSTSINHNEKSYADDAGRKALLDMLNRRRISGDVHFTDWKFFYRVERKITSFPVISVVIHSGSAECNEEYLTELFNNTTYPNVEYMLLEASGQEDVEILGEPLRSRNTFRVVTSLPDANLAERLNSAAKLCKGEYVVFLHADVVVTSHGWLNALLEHCQDGAVFAAGGRINKAYDQQKVFTTPDLSVGSAEYHATFLRECSRHLNGLQCIQNVWALSWDMLMVKQSVFLDFGGFDTHFKDRLYADVDLCFRMVAQGGMLTYTPFAAGTLKESRKGASATTVSAELESKEIFCKKWKRELLAGDPFYNLGVLKEKDISTTDFLQWIAG